MVELMWRGMDADGNIIANVLNAIGVNAEWINVLTNFTVGNNFNVDAQGNLTASNANITGTVNATSGSFTGSITGAEINNGNGTFSVSTSGKLKATNADITGKITATSGKISGFDIQDNQISVTFSKTFGPFTSADVTKVQGFVLKTNTPTDADFEKYDMTGKRSFSVVDIAYVQRMVQGVDPNPRTVNYTLRLRTGQSNNMIEITSSIGTSIKNNIGAGGITTHTGTFNRVDVGNLELNGKTVYVDDNGYLRVPT